MSSTDNDRILDGKKLSAEIIESIKNDIEKDLKLGRNPPTLAVILTGSRPDSSTYVRMKEKACSDAGINFRLEKFPDDVSESTLIETSLFYCQLLLFCTFNI